jgi:hypothetical protein
MKRSLLAVVAGLAAWVLVASLLNRGVRVTLGGYAAAEPRMTFTLAMLAARLMIGALASISAGAVAGSIAPRGSRPVWVLGAILLAAFVPQHVWLWRVFPLWYHLTFLVTLLPLVVLGAHLTRARPPAKATLEPKRVGR